MTFARILHAALRSVSLRIGLAAVLLFAQHAALTHAVTHAGGQPRGGSAQVHAPVQPLAQDGGTPAHQAANWCAFDLAYSQVLGGTVFATADFLAAAGVVEQRTPRACARIVAEPPPFLAQGPPAFL